MWFGRWIHWLACLPHQRWWEAYARGGSLHLSKHTRLPPSGRKREEDICVHGRTISQAESRFDHSSCGGRLGPYEGKRMKAIPCAVFLRYLEAVLERANFQPFHGQDVPVGA